MRDRTQDPGLKTQGSNGLTGSWTYRLMRSWAYGFVNLSAYQPISLFCISCLVFCLCWTAVSEARIIEKILVIVNDEIITKTELDERLSKEKELRRVFYQYDEARLSEEMERLRPEILEAMVNELLFTQEAVKRGIRVSDDEIQKFLNSIKSQYDSTEAFEEALKAEGYTVDTFKKERKRILLRQKLIQEEFGSELEVSDEAVREFYRENRDQLPGRSDAVKLKHIFIKFHTTEADREKARQRASDILKRCREGADFVEMAEKFSDHKVTKASGGDMGYFIPGMGKYDPKLEEAASKLAVGEISDLIETPGGYDIIKVTDIKDTTFRAQRIHIAIWPDQESERHAEEKVYFILEELNNGADFVDLAEKYSDDPLAKDKAGDWKDISIDLMTPDLRGSFDSFEEGEVSQPVKTPLGFHIFKIVKRQDLTDDEMEQIRSFLSEKQLQEKLKEYSEKLKEKAYIQRLAEN